MRIFRKWRTLLCLLIILTAALIMTACSSYDNFKRTFIDRDADDEVIYIGVFEPESGGNETTGLQEIKGIELAHDIYSNVKGVRVELIRVDTESNSTAATNAIEDLIQMNPVAIIGSSEEANSMIAGSAIEEAKIPMITPSAANPLITENNPYYFRACITQTQRGTGLAEYAYEELHSRSIAIVTVENDSTQETMENAFRDEIRELAGDLSSIVMTEQIPVDDFDAGKLAKKIQSSGASVVFMPIGLENADQLFDEIEKLGTTDITFLGNENWSTDDLIQIAEGHPDIKIAFASDSVLGKDGNTTNTVTAETQRFLVTYADKYGAEDIPTQNAALGYDSYLLLINAINTSKSLEPEDIRDALAKTDNLRCATGVFHFDDDGNPVRTVNISTVSDGKIVSAYVTESSTESSEMKKIEK